MALDLAPLVRRQHLLHPRRADDSGCNGVDADGLRRGLLRRSAYKMMQSRLGRAIGHLLAHAPHTGEGADEGKRAASRLGNSSRAVLQGEERMTQNEAELPVPFLVGIIRQRLQ